MPGFTFDGSDFPMKVPKVSMFVLRLDEDDKYELMPSLMVDTIAIGEGLNYGNCELIYAMDDSRGYPYPSSIAQILPASSPRGTAVRIDDYLVIAYINPLGKLQIMFAGFAQIPAAEIGGGQSASVKVVAAPVRCWDSVIKDAVFRDGSSPFGVSLNIKTNRPVAFNPDGKGNRTPEGGHREGPPVDGVVPKDPVFLDPTIGQATRWTIADAVTHILTEYNDQVWVRNPDMTVLGDLLDALEPTQEGGFIDPQDANTFRRSPIYVNEGEDSDVTGKPWPEAVFDLINKHGFTIIWRLDTDEKGLPDWNLEILRSSESDVLTEKTVSLQPRGSNLDLSRSNVSSLVISHEATAIVNAYHITPAPTIVEASFMLSPLFPVLAADLTQLESFKLSAPGFAAVRDKYRWFGLDELGAGHWNFASGGMVTTLPNLSAIFAGPNGKKYVPSYRKASRDLISKGADGRAITGGLSWILANDYAGPVPGLWDNSAADKFQPAKGAWKLDIDRLAIRITVEDPSQFHFGDHSGLARGGTMPIPEWLNSSAKRFHFRVTLKVTSDFAQEIYAGRRKASPTAYTVKRMIMAGERYKPSIISKSSEYNATGKPIPVEDTTKEATADVMARRYATEIPPYAGPITIGYFTEAYRLGDRISKVDGTELSFAPSASDGEPPSYPRVVGIQWNFQGGQRTALTVSDRRVGRHKNFS